MRSVTTGLLVLFLTGFSLAANAQAKEEFSVANNVDFSKSIKLFPNPAVEFVSVKFEEPIAKQTKLTLHNIIGNTLEVEREVIDDYEIRLRVKDLAIGYYLLAVKDENSSNRSTFKFLKR